MQTAIPTPTKSGHAAVNGVNYYYEIHGEGEPLLLLHGGLGSIDMFAPILPTLAENRQVIAVDLQGHGRTALGDRQISLIDMGDDMAAVLKRARLRPGRRARLFDGRRRRVPARGAASRRRCAAWCWFGGFAAGRLLPRDAAAAGAGRRRDGGA